MSRNVDFTIPFEVRANPDLEQARQRHTAWALSSGLLPGREFSSVYEAWDFPAMMAYVCPDISPVRLDLAINAIAFGFMWDDQYERLCTQNMDKALPHAQEMISTMYLPSERFAGPDVPQAARIWAGLWADINETMSLHWRARATSNWAWLTASFLHQAHDRLLGVPDLQHYSHVRRGVAGVDFTLDCVEAFWDCEPPVVALHGPQLWAIREATVLATTWCNDVYSLEKEEADGDVDNIVLVLENTRHCSRQEAINEIVKMVNQEMIRFEKATRQLPEMYSYFGLKPQEQHTVERWVQMHAAWLGGYHHWEKTTARYAGAHAPGGRRMPIENLVQPATV